MIQSLTAKKRRNSTEPLAKKNRATGMMSQSKNQMRTEGKALMGRKPTLRVTKIPEKFKSIMCGSS